MNDRNRLLQWMESRNLKAIQLANATGDPRSAISQMINGHREINQAFKWRFGKAFGFDIANEIFVDEPVGISLEAA